MEGSHIDDMEVDVHSPMFDLNIVAEDAINLDDSNSLTWHDMMLSVEIEGEDHSTVPSIEAEVLKEKTYDWTPHFSKGLVFETRSKLEEWIKKFCVENHMLLIVKKSDLGSKRRHRIIYACDREGKYRPPKERKDLTHAQLAEQKKKKKKDTGTKKCQCPFAVKFVKVHGSEDRWEFAEVNCGHHNHDLYPYIEGHAYHARLNVEEKKVFRTLHETGLKPKQTLMAIKTQFPENTSSLQTVYNERKKYDKVKVDGKSEFQQLEMEAEKAGYVIQDVRDYHDDTCHDFFFAHPDSIALAKCFPYTFIMDCTYKTNIHHWPLFEVVGVTSTGKSFPVCYAFLEKETTDHFVWALNCFKGLLGNDQVPTALVSDKDQALMKALDIVFPNTPHLLCVWRIGTGIDKTAKKILPKVEDEDVAKKLCKEVYRPACVTDFEKGWQEKLKQKYRDMWNLVVWAKTIEEFETKLEELRVFFQEWTYLYEYAQGWLEWKEKFVCFWTNQVFHLGNTSTNRVEGAHGTLKVALNKSSQHTFLTMYRLINNHLNIQVSEIKKTFTKSHYSRLHNTDKHLFYNLKQIVSVVCLKMLREEYEKYLKGWAEDDRCDCSIKVTHGIPCACTIGAISRTNGAVELASIHDHWKKLSVVPRRVEYDELELHEEFQLWCKKYYESTPDVKRYLLRRLREDSSRATTWLNTPLEPVKNKGRPKGFKNKKDDSSNKRDPSAHEYEIPDVPNPPEGQYFHQPNPSSNQIPLKKSQPKKRKRTDPPKYKVLREYLPKNFEPYIDDIIDVEGDGNCGFRAAAVGLGMSEHTGWVTVRNDLVAELDKNFPLYSKNFGGAQYVIEQRTRINSFKTPTLDTNDFWMEMPWTGYVLANMYGRVVVYMAKTSDHYTFCSFVPQIMSPPPRRRGEATLLPQIGIMHTGNHYVCVKLKPWAPIPPATPTSLRNRLPSAEGWDALMWSRKEAFIKLFPDQFVIVDTVDVDLVSEDDDRGSQKHCGLETTRWFEDLAQ